MAKKVTIQTHFNELWVRPRPHDYSGIGLHDIRDLDPDKAYRVLATFMHRFDDGSTEPAFMLQDEDRIITRACVIFRVAEVK